MITISIFSEEQKYTSAIDLAIANHIKTDPNLAGSEYKIIVDDWNRGVDGCDRINAAQLFATLNGAVEEARGA